MCLPHANTCLAALGCDAAGRPYPGVQATIRDADGNELPAGMSGRYTQESGTDARVFRRPDRNREYHRRWLD